MSEHLSVEQIFEAMAGRKTLNIDAHLRLCPTCSMEVDRMQTSIAGLSKVIHKQAERHAQALPRRINWIESRPQASNRPLAWILAAAVLSIAVSLPVYEKFWTMREDLQYRDAGLLETIDTQLSREVPASMETLMELMQEDEE